MQAALDWARQSLKEMGVFEAEDGLRWAAAHGIVVSVWRNSPVEDAHASRPTSRRKALHDGTMFARNTWLTRQAFDALGSESRFRFYDLEDLILDRDLVWPGCEGTLTDFGWGFLGDIKKHVRHHIGMLAHFERRLPPEDFLLFAGAPRIGTHVDHYGMPRWPACVEAAMSRLHGEDEEFWRTRRDLMTRIGPAPAGITGSLEAPREGCWMLRGNWAPTTWTGSPGTRSCNPLVRPPSRGSGRCP